jgi:hypothetical protein
LCGVAFSGLKSGRTNLELWGHDTPLGRPAFSSHL